METNYLIGVDNPKRINECAKFFVEENDDIIKIIIHSRVAKGILPHINFGKGLTALVYEKREGGFDSIQGHEAYIYFVEKLRELGKDINDYKERYNPILMSKPYIQLGTQYKPGEKIEDEEGIYVIDVNSAYTAGHIEVDEYFKHILCDVYYKKATAQNPAKRQYYKDILNKLNGYFSTVNGLGWLYNKAIDKANEIIIDAINVIAKRGGVVLRVATDSITFWDKEHFFRNLDKFTLMNTLNIGPNIGQFKLEGIWDTFIGYSPNHIIYENFDGTRKIKHSGIKKAESVGTVVEKEIIKESNLNTYSSNSRKYNIVKYKLKDNFKNIKKENIENGKDKENQENQNRNVCRLDGKTSDAIQTEICRERIIEARIKCCIEEIQIEPTEENSKKSEVLSEEQNCSQRISSEEESSSESSESSEFKPHNGRCKIYKPEGIIGSRKIYGLYEERILS